MLDGQQPNDGHLVQKWIARCWLHSVHTKKVIWLCWVDQLNVESVSRQAGQTQLTQSGLPYWMDNLCRMVHHDRVNNNLVFWHVRVCTGILSPPGPLGDVWDGWVLSLLFSVDLDLLCLELLGLSSPSFLNFLSLSFVSLSNDLENLDFSSVSWWFVNDGQTQLMQSGLWDVGWTSHTHTHSV